MTSTAQQPKANGKPIKGGISAAQGYPFMGGVGGVDIGWPGVAGGSATNHLAFPGWGTNRYGVGYNVYRWMLQHPMIQSVRGKVFNRATASKWTIDAPNENVRNWFQTSLIPQREPYFVEALRSLDYGHSCFEIVWDQDDKGMYFFRPRSLLVDFTPIIPDFVGGFLGFNVALRQDLTDQQRRAIQAMTAAGENDKPGLIRPNLPYSAFMSLLITFDGEGGNLYGRSILENIRETAWKPWLLCAQQLAALGGKLTERQGYAVVPPGGYDDATGPRTYRQDAEDALALQAQGKCPILVKPMPDPGTTDAEVVAAYAGKSFVEFATIDYGSNSSAVKYLTDLMSYYDGLIFHGYQQSPRAGMESQNGSRADSQQHTETDTLFVERVARLMTEPLQRHVDETARINFSLPPGAVQLKQMDINDPLLQFKQSVYNALVTNTATGPTVSRGIGLTQLQNDVGVPVNTSLKPGDLEKMLVAQQDQQTANAKAQAEASAKPAGADGAAPPTK